MNGSTDQYVPDLVRDNQFIDPPKAENYHLSEDLIETVIEYIGNHLSIIPENPFFLSLSFGAQHDPHQVPKEYIKKYEGIYDNGWDYIRKKRFERQKELNIIPMEAELAPRNPGVRSWDSLSFEEKEVFAKFQEVYAGFLTHTDEQIGVLMRSLEEMGVLDNTVFIFLSDNGASPAGGFNGSINRSKVDNGMEEKVEELYDSIDEMGGTSTQSNYPRGWAQVSNTPFKYYKKNTYFGGARVPLIIQWPDGIKKKGEIRDQYHHVIDVTPTILDILDIKMPDVYKGVTQLPLHGKSMFYTFNDNAPSARKTQYFELLGDRAIYHEGWKAVTLHKTGTSFDQDKWELYNVEDDFSEFHDLSDQYPQMVKKLKEKWLEEAEQFSVLRLNPAVAPSITNSSYKITVSIYRERKEDEGVLVALGNFLSGYTFFILNNRLYFEYNYFSKAYTIQSDTEIPNGCVNVAFKFKKETSNSGQGDLYINDN
ncbi:arylsulfatase [Alteribacillus bidgolensis]|uniref:Arylsulfatase n=1 Tax=Alteribacillus bidgolensis TaxID=930129 RepID=A0A1G8QV39_9BACI|nr:arylsulfatase [Alteribacillus bidgolensis]